MTSSARGARLVSVFALLTTLAALLAPAALGGTLTYTAPTDASANRLRLRQNGSNLELTDERSGALLRTAPVATTTGAVIQGTDGVCEDSLLVDFSGGMFALADGIRYDGGRAGFDSLAVEGGFARRTGHNIINEHSGILRFDDLEIHYSNLEPVTDLVPSATYTINGTDAGNTITVDNGTANGDGILRVSIAGSESIEFANKTAVIINGGLSSADIGDTININFTEVATGLTSITINGDDQAGTATPLFGDFISIQATAVLTNINGGGGSESFVFSDGATLSGGAIDGGAGTSDVLNYTSYTTPVSVNLGLNTVGMVATLGGDQENPPTTSTATGTATLTYNISSKTFDITVTVVDLAPANVTGFHIHRAPVGINGPIIVDFTPGGVPIAPLVPVGTGFTFTATNVVLPAAHEAALLGGFTYLNIHTAANPGGAIRGQLFSTGNVNLATGTATGAPAVSNVENAQGGSAGDSLVGSFAANSLLGRGGDDTIVGGPGADDLDGAAGADSFAWNNGDGSDSVDGDDDSDTLQVNGSLSADDVFTIGANADRIAFARTSPGPFTIDAGAIETLIVNGITGNDSFAVNSLAGVTDLTLLNLNGFDGNDSFSMIASSTVTMNVRGGLPANVLPGDSLTYNAEGRTISGDLTPPDGVINSPGVQPVNFLQIETVNLANAVLTADLAVSKTATSPAIIGEILSYFILVTNLSSQDAINVALTDLVPANTTFVSFTAPGGWSVTTPPAGGTGTVTATTSALAAGATASFTFVVRIDPSTTPGTIIVNTATATTTSVDPNPSNNSALSSVSASPQAADLSVTKSASAGPFLPGDNISYTIVVTNGGPQAATNVQLSDTLPANTTFVSFTAPAGWTSTTPPAGGTGTVTATNPSLAAGASATFILLVNINSSTAGDAVISNTATASSATVDTDPADNSATASITVTPPIANLSVTKTSGTGPFLPGSSIVYTIVVSNAGPNAAENVVLTDALPAGTTFLSIAAPAGWTVSAPAVDTNGTVIATIPILAAGTSASFTLAVRAVAAEGAEISNTASVTSDTGDPDGANNSASVTATLLSFVAVPTLSPALLMALMALLATAALMKIGRS